MDTNILLVLGLIAVALAAAGFALFMRSRGSARLRRRFGPEYQRALEANGGRGQGEAHLRDRQKRVEAFAVKPLGAGDKERFGVSWRRAQEEFVDQPARAVTRADELLCDVMSVRGYPVSEFEQRSADLSVDHPSVVQNYRAAHEIAVRHGRGEASTEDLRQAMIHYRALFDELVGGAEPVLAKAT